MTRIRVLRVITRMNIGGPAINAGLLTARMDPKRFETLLVSGREGPAEGSMLELGRVEAGVAPLRVDALGRSISPWDDARALARLVAIARAFRPQIVHTHLAKAGFLGRLAGRAAGARVLVHTYHGSVFRAYFGRRESSLYMAIERGLARLSTRLVAITPLQRDELIQLRIAPAWKIVEIPLGLDLTAFRSDGVSRTAARLALGLDPDRPAVGIVARLVPVKDVGTFIKAFRLLRDAVPGAQAIIVGDGEERGPLTSLAAGLGIGEGQCRFLGWRADMPTVYRAVDALALSSLNEGSPVTAIEAMAAGTPVVATRVGGVPDVIEDGVNGRLVEPRDPPALADALATLLTDVGLRERLSSTARRSVYPRFSADRLVSDMERLYEELLAAPIA